MIRVHFDKEIVSHLLKSLIFVEYVLNCISMVSRPHHSLYPEPQECHSHYFFKIRFNIILQSTFQYANLSLTIVLSDQMFLIHFLSFSCLLLVLSISPSLIYSFLQHKVSEAIRACSGAVG